MVAIKNYAMLKDDIVSIFQDGILFDSFSSTAIKTYQKNDWKVSVNSDKTIRVTYKWYPARELKNNGKLVVFDKFEILMILFVIGILAITRIIPMYVKDSVFKSFWCIGYLNRELCPSGFL